MYVGIDFLIDRGRELYLSEVNTGVPAGATEFDLVHRSRLGRRSDVFARIESLSREAYGKSFRDFIHELPWLDELARLKIWMDGRGPLPPSPHPALRLEDKWVQYGLLSPRFPMAAALLWTGSGDEPARVLLEQDRRLVFKPRLGRGGRGLTIIRRMKDLEALSAPAGSGILQAFIDSRIGPWAFSIRAAAFAGEFLGLFASLARRATSNHGIRFHVSPGDRFGLSNPGFRYQTVHRISREAVLFFRGRIPGYLQPDIHIERVADAEIRVPAAMLDDIRNTAAAVSRLYTRIDFDKLPRSWAEGG